ncbi:MAG: HEPN domain-containing protein [Kiloniellales bacterium]
MTPEQTELLQLADESIEAAELLLKNNFPGFTASRAYYAMFATAEALLLTKDLSFSKHSAVIAAFGKHFAKTGIVPVELHRAILNAQLDRQAADYGGDRRITQEDAARHVDNAKNFLRCARSILEGQESS